MKKLLALLILCLPSCAFGQDLKNKDDFEKDLKLIGSAVENFDKDNFYKPYDFKHAKTGVAKKLKDFSPLELQVFYVLQAERLTKNLKKLQDKWEDYLIKLNTDNNVNVNIATAKDVERYIERLNTLRKKLAVKYEFLAEKMLKDFPDDFTDEEKKHIMDKIKNYHNNNYLINRS